MNAVSMVLSVLLVGYLVVLVPVWGRRTYDRLVRDRERDPGAYPRMMRLWLADGWGQAAVALLIVALSADLTLGGAGLVRQTDLSTTAGLLVGACIGAAVLALVLRRSARAGRGLPGQVAAYSALLPRTPAERRYAAGLAVTAGITEEIVFRGVLIGVGVHVLGLPLPVAAALSLAVFVAGHLYQGWKGMPAVTLAGLGLTLLYLRTGSLLLPIVAHVLIDLRSLLLVPAPRPRALDAAVTVER